jgi:hypothetical protein
MNYETKFIENKTKSVILTLDNTYYDPNTPQRVIIIDDKLWNVAALYDVLTDVKITRNIYVELANQIN